MLAIAERNMATLTAFPWSTSRPRSPTSNRARVARPTCLVGSAAATYQGVAAGIRQERGAPSTSIDGPIGIGRRIGVRHVALQEVRGLAHSRGVEVNDVFLYLVARSLRAVVLKRGNHSSGDTKISGNLVGNITVLLPPDVADPPEGSSFTGSSDPVNLKSVSAPKRPAILS